METPKYKPMKKQIEELQTALDEANINLEKMDMIEQTQNEILSILQALKDKG